MDARTKQITFVVCGEQQQYAYVAQNTTLPRFPCNDQYVYSVMQAFTDTA
jgi:hypothetical protein